MKKMISLLLIVCMACMLIPATAEGVTGLWYMVEMVANDVTINPAQMGINWTMELSEDGTAYNRMEAMGEVQEKSGTWTLDGDTVTVTIEDSPAAFQLVDGKLTIEMDGQTAVFSQEAPEAAVKPGVVAAESEEAFFGDWEIEAVDMMGMYMGKDMFAAAGMEGFTVKLSIEAGKVTMSSKMSASAEEQSQTFDSRFEDGKLPSPFHTTPSFVTDSSALAERFRRFRYRGEGHGGEGLTIRFFEIREARMIEN